MTIKKKLDNYLKNHLTESFLVGNIETSRKASIPIEECQLEESSLNNYINTTKEDNNFQKLLFEYIDNKNLKDSDVYNKAMLDRRLFSKIRTKKDYHPSKETIISLGLALELSEEEIINLLNSASYYLPKNNTFDLIIRFCFINKIYDIITVNELLYEYNCKLLNE